MQIVTDLSNGVRNIADHLFHPMATRRGYTLQKRVKVVRRVENSLVPQGMAQQGGKDVTGDEDCRVTQGPLQKEVKAVKGGKDRRKTREMQWQLRDAGFDMGQGTYRRIKNDFFDPENEAVVAAVPRTQKDASSSVQSARLESIREVLARNRKESAEVALEQVDDAATSSMITAQGHHTKSYGKKMSV